MLLQRSFSPCNALAQNSAGFEAPVAELPDLLCRRVGGADLLQLRLQSRILPVAAINEALAERIDAFKRRTRIPPTRQESRELKEEIYTQLLPQALLKSDRISAMFLQSEEILVVGTVSENMAEMVINNLSESTGQRFAPVVFNRPANEFMNAILLGNGPAEFTLGRDCRMRDPEDYATSVSWLDIDLADRSIRQHLHDGLQLDRLGLNFEHTVQFSLDNDLAIRKFKFAEDNAIEIPDAEEEPLATLDADIALTAGTITRLFRALRQKMGNYGN